MLIDRPRFRLLMLIAAAGFLAVALMIRAGQVDSTGAVEQISGTVLYASMVYVGVLFLRPRCSPFVAGAVAWAWCWATELFQLTGIPAELSDRSLLARLALGARFDLVDLFWYPAGIVPLVALHWVLGRRGR
ncbi:membrane protein [Asanoa ishikariensis]|uniref:DUF2809 domain-containing protein n=1 Tax=Asanoa ishikariensis TaxID=137265 RepID=A0A1H3TX56_9ACTN|nr:DUF2809 domain-containing protein [Asanoa ishikariensis]GIF67635.1 membrane protein [Asanoa ishikariensis]SDZ54786.1 Protein of unknown function [Asanoa ishikariensis]